MLESSCNKPARPMPPPPPPHHQHLQARGQPEVTYLTLANQRLPCSQNTDTAMQSGHRHCHAVRTQTLPCSQNTDTAMQSEHRHCHAVRTQTLPCSQNTDTAMQSEHRHCHAVRARTLLTQTLPCRHCHHAVRHTYHNCVFKSTSISVNLGPILLD